MATATFAGGFGLDFVEGMFPADFVLDDFDEGDVCDAEAGGIGDEGAAHAATAAVQLTDAAGDEVYEDVGIAHLVEGFTDQFGIHGWCVP